MKTCTDIREQVGADARLQQEISHALLAVAEALAADGDYRIVRILARTLEASWDEHVSFQHEVIFPIIISRHGDKLNELVDGHRAEHASLTQLHAEIGHHLEALLEPAHEQAAGLETLLRRTHAQRLLHLSREDELHAWLPDSLDDGERSLCEKWLQTRPSLRFPLNLLREGGRPFPSLGGGRVH